MFKKHAIQVKMVKDKHPKKASNENMEANTSPEEIAEIVTGVVEDTTIIVQKAVIETMLVATGCKIAVILVKAMTR